MHDYKLLKAEDVNYPLGYFFNMATPRSGHNFIKNNIMSWTNDVNNDKRLYVNLEGHKPENFYEKVDRENLSLYPNSIKILVLRSLLNWIPSFLGLLQVQTDELIKKSFYENHANYIKKSKIIHNKEFIELQKINPAIVNTPYLIVIPDDSSKEDFVKTESDGQNVNRLINGAMNRWLSHAKELTGETTYLKGFTKVYYDEFFVSQSYRKDICHQIGGVYNENVLNIVTPPGRYSSFDKDKFQNDGQSMNVLRRWEQWTVNLHHLQTVKNHEALDFYINNFSISTDEMKFINSI